jgi:class 3 adenylate cyclase/tetratricopeptide (TPR) repeat protein
LVSVLFADLVGYTGFAENRDAEEVREVLSDYFAAAREIVERFGGVVEKYIGDAVMAVWGAPLAREDDAERAVRAGLELIDMVDKLGARLGIEGFALRGGVASGEASVSPGGNGTGMVVGDLVNTASRLQAIAEPKAVVVGGTTYRLVKDAVRFVSLGSLQLKGRSEPVEAWRAERVTAARGGRYRGEAVEAPFVGRDEDLRHLKDLLHATGKENRSRLASVIGQAGVGKSRLIWELEKYIDGLVAPTYWHRGRSPSLGDGLAFWALADMVRSRAGIAPSDDNATAKSRLAASVAEFVAPGDRAWVEANLVGLLGLGPSPEGERAEQFAAFRSFFEGISGRGTTVMVFEDFQHSDEALIDFVEELTDWSRHHPILVVTAARPELLTRRPGWGSGRRGFVSIHLGSLTNEAMESLVLGLVPGITEEVAKSVVDRAGGIPLYAIELVRKLIADGVLVEEEGGCFCAVVGDISEVSVPDSLQAVIGARLDQLSSDERSLLQHASIIGLNFTPESLAAVSNLPVEHVESMLPALIRKELIDMVRDPRSGERGSYSFVQSLVRDVAHGRLGREPRRTGHAAAGRYFAGLSGAELAGVASAHFLEALGASSAGREADALREEAAKALSVAAERAFALHSYERVIELCREALRIVATESANLEFLLLAGTAHGRLAQFDDAAEYVERAHRWALTAGDDRTRMKTARVLARINNDALRSDDALAVLEPVMTSQADRTDSPDWVAGAAELARSYMLTSRAEDALAMVERALSGAERLGIDGLIADALVTKGSILGDVGRVIEGRALLREALDLARAKGLHAARSRALNNLGFLLGEDDPQAYLATATEALAEGIRLGARNQVIWYSVALAGYYLGSGKPSMALQYLESPIVSGGQGFYDLSIELLWAKYHALLGDYVTSDQHMERAEQIGAGETARQIAQSLSEARGSLLVFRGRFTEALPHCRHAAAGPFERAYEVLGFAIAAALARDDMALAEATQMAGRLQRHTTMAAVSREFTAAVDAARRGDYEQTEAHAAFVLEQLGGWEQLVLGACVRAALAANALGSVRERYLAEVEDGIEASGLLGLKPMLAEVEAARAGLSSVGSPSG